MINEGYRQLVCTVIEQSMADAVRPLKIVICLKSYRVKWKDVASFENRRFFDDGVYKIYCDAAGICPDMIYGRYTELLSAALNRVGDMRADLRKKELTLFF